MPSAFIIFSGERREALKAQGLSFGEIGKACGAEWKKLSPTEKAKYEARATPNERKEKPAKKAPKAGKKGK
jgi:hypothetical protein